MRIKILTVMGAGLVFLLFLTGIYMILYGRAPFSLFASKNPAGQIIDEAKARTVPIAFFVYTCSKDKKKWIELTGDPQVKEKISMFIVKIVPVRFIKNQFPEYYSKNPVSSLMICDYKGRKISYHKGIIDKETLLTAIANALDYHEKLILSDQAAKKEFFKVKSVYDSKKYIIAMEKLRNYLYIYANSDYAKDVRAMLNSASQTPQVLDYLKENRDKTNLRLLLDRLKENYEYKRFFNVERIVSAIQQTNPGTQEAQQAQEIKEKMEEYAREKFKEINELYEKKYFIEAIEAYESLRTQFKGTHWELFIAGKIQKIQGDPQYHEYMKNAQSNREAKNILRRADESFENKNYDMAEQYYSAIIRFYKDSLFVQKAKQQINEINRLRNMPAEEPANN